MTITADIISFPALAAGTQGALFEGLPGFGVPSTDEDRAAATVRAARALAGLLPRGRRVSKVKLRREMDLAFGGTDAAGAWGWKDAWNACELAQVAHVVRFAAPLGLDGQGTDGLAETQRLDTLFQTYTTRSEAQIELQQFGTPLPLSYLAVAAGQVGPEDLVLEPSAGMGPMAGLAVTRGAEVMANEYDPVRAGALGAVLRQEVSRVDGARIDDLLQDGRRPSVVLMNPPFGSSFDGEDKMTAARHVKAALRRLAPGGRLVAIVGEGFRASGARYGRYFEELAKLGTVTLTAALPPRAFARAGTTAATRLVVIDKLTGADAPQSLGDREASDLGELAALVDALPARGPVEAARGRETLRVEGERVLAKRRPAPKPVQATGAMALPQGEPLAYEPRTDYKDSKAEGLYQPYELKRIAIPGAQPHRDKLVQTMTLAGVRPPLPAARPVLPRELVTTGTLSDAQLEAVIYAEEAHSKHLAGRFEWQAKRGPVPAPTSGRAYRRGFFIGDNTGVGKGREVAGIILSNMLQGRRKAVWVSKNKELLEDARRDWQAVGGLPEQVRPLSQWKPGQPVNMAEGILFVPYGTLRSTTDAGSRLEQVVAWLGEDFGGVIAFDEAHEMQGALPDVEDEDAAPASIQGLAGITLQQRVADARVVYVSATNAERASALGYADRLGLWRGPGAPFGTNAEFAAAMAEGGVAALEAVCRDLVALGLYTSRSLDYSGVEVEILTCPLTAEQRADYGVLARAYEFMHERLEAALEAVGATQGRPRGKFMAQFEGTKQRVFAHALNAMKMPEVLRSADAALERGEAVVFQLVSTGEAVAERVIGGLTKEDFERGDVDLTPRRVILDYLDKHFPVQAFEEFVNEHGTKIQRPSFDTQGRPVVCPEAMELRQEIVEHLACLPELPSALDQITWHYGPDRVAECTGRGRRIVREPNGSVTVERRPGSATAAEARAFAEDRKQVLAFSAAGGTGRSYHADREVKNQRRRNHYCIEFGWRASVAMQGLGRTNRTNQASAPRFIPCTTDVRGECRFVSTIASRLESLGALTKGERKAGSQGMFRREDDMTSQQGAEALTLLLGRMETGQFEAISPDRFQKATGLDMEKDIPVTRFLNRMMALAIEEQNVLFEEFERLMSNRIEAALESGELDRGVEVLTADRIEVTTNDVLATDPATGAETRMIQVKTFDKIKRRSAAEVMKRRPDGVPYINGRSGGVAWVTEAGEFTELEGGETYRRVYLRRPRPHMDGPERAEAFHGESAWRECDHAAFEAAWDAEVADLPTEEVGEFALVTGLLLPHWKKLPAKRQELRRLTDENGEAHLGRVMTIIEAQAVARGFGSRVKVELTPRRAVDALARGETVEIGRYTVASAMRAGRRRFMATGATRYDLARFKAAGCTTEIRGTGKLEVFLPLDPRAARAVIEAMMEAEEGEDLPAAA